MTLRVEPKTPRHYALEAQSRLFPCPPHERVVTLPDIALLVRASTDGTSDPWPDEQLKEVREMLAARLETWEVRVDRMDSQIYRMCELAIELIDNELLERAGKPPAIPLECPKCGPSTLTVHVAKGDKPVTGICAKCKGSVFFVYVD